MLEGFFLGFLVTIIATVIVSVLYGLSSESADIKEILKKAELIGSIKYRFKIIEQYTNEQMDLIVQSERPSASAAHSKHKNKIISRLKELEDLKSQIMQSILDDGIDPTITIQTPEGPKNVKMSEALNLRKQILEQPAKTDPIIPRNSKQTHLRLVKNEDSGDTSHPKVPRA